MIGQLRLGTFTFQPTGPSYQAIQDSYSYKWTDQEILQSPNKQYWGGKQSHTMTIEGFLYPDMVIPQFTDAITGVVSTYAAIQSVRNSYAKLDAMASSGRSFTLVDVSGRNYGTYVIVGLTINKSRFWADGIARKSDFTLQLRRDLSGDQEETLLDKVSDIAELTIIKARDLFN